jgi:phosphoglycolate phosphatase-like HAD superfamily hydrolase
VFFDVDGVLLDSLPMHLEICEDLNREWELGLRIPPLEEFRTVANTGIRLSPMKTFFMVVGFREEEAERAEAYYRLHFLEKYSPQPYPHIGDVLRRLRDAGLVLGIATANVRANVERALGSSWDLFDSRLLYTFDQGLSKAEALEDGVRQLGIQPGEAVLVGDQFADRDAAQQAGVRFLGVTYGWAIAPGHTGFDMVQKPEELAVYLLAEQGIHT